MKKIQFLLIRFLNFYKANGASRTITRAFGIIKRSIYKNRFMLFYAELTDIKENEPIVSGNNITIECRKSKTDLTSQELTRLYVIRNNFIFDSQLRNRFDKGAILWLAKQNDEIIGFVWSISGKTIQPYFFPLLKKDVHIFDNEISHEFRGHGYNTSFIDCVLRSLKAYGYRRAFMETREWNNAEIKSLSKTNLKIYSSGRKKSILSVNISIWPKNKYNTGGF